MIRLHSIIRGTSFSAKSTSPALLSPKTNQVQPLPEDLRHLVDEAVGERFCVFNLGLFGLVGVAPWELSPDLLEADSSSSGASEVPGVGACVGAGRFPSTGISLFPTPERVLLRLALVIDNHLQANACARGGSSKCEAPFRCKPLQMICFAFSSSVLISSFKPLHITSISSLLKRLGNSNCKVKLYWKESS
jgi:hypothetical protein